jgi:hypothetical protein
MFGPCEFDKRQHLIIHPPLEDWIKRQAPNDDERGRLFIYKHLVHGTFVIAWWVSKDRGLFVDMINLKKSLGSFNRRTANRFLQQLKPSSDIRDKMIRQLGKAENDNLYGLNNEHGETSDQMDRQRSTKTMSGYG